MYGIPTVLIRAKHIHMFQLSKNVSIHSYLFLVLKIRTEMGLTYIYHGSHFLKHQIDMNRLQVNLGNTSVCTWENILKS